MTPEERAALRDWHSRKTRLPMSTLGLSCMECAEPAPCTMIQLLDALDAAEADLRQVREERDNYKRLYDEATHQDKDPSTDKITVHFKGGPWDGETLGVTTVVGPVFAAGHSVGNHYWLDNKSDPPTYFWDGPQGRLIDG